MQNVRSGFTLIELSIVLVIIGLIISGILVGKEMIRAAEVRKTVTMIEHANAAINTFYGKYNCLPGDCANATALLGSTAINGNGNGYIDGFDEANVWQHLSLAGLYEGTYAGSTNPTGIMCGQGFYTNCRTPGYLPLTPMNYFLNVGYSEIVNTSNAHVQYAHYFMLSYEMMSGLGYGSNWSGGWASGANGSTTAYDTTHNLSSLYMSPGDAQAIDSKIDDGLPLSGTMQIWYQNGRGCTNWWLGTNAYNITVIQDGLYWPVQQYNCAAFIRASGF